MIRRRIDAAEVRQLARGNWLEILQSLAGDQLADALARPGRHVDCPFHGGANDFRLDGNTSRLGSAAENGGAVCTCGTWKDGFALLMQARGWSFREALVEVARVLGMEAGRGAASSAERRRRLEQARKKAAAAEKRRARKRQAQSRRAIAAIRQAWDRSIPLSDKKARAAQIYLARRKLTHQALAGCADIRFVPRLICFQSGDDGKLVKIGHYPAIVALIRDPSGNPVTLHRTYLTPGGSKLPVQKPKKLMSVPDHTDLHGSAIRLFPVNAGVMGVAEGIETALAVQYATGMPVWSTVSAAMMAGFEPPPGVERIIIWADKDRSGAGMEAARKLAERLREQGLSGRIVQPDLPIPDSEKSVDWADVWRRTGILGFPRWHPEILRCA